MAGIAEVAQVVFVRMVEVQYLRARSPTNKDGV
jgi:hypothetical protein